MPYNIKGEAQVEHGFGLPQKTTVELSTYTPPRDGYVVFDTTLQKVVVYRSTSWEIADAFLEFVTADDQTALALIAPTGAAIARVSRSGEIMIWDGSFWQYLQRAEGYQALSTTNLPDGVQMSSDYLSHIAIATTNDPFSIVGPASITTGAKYLITLENTTNASGDATFNFDSVFQNVDGGAMPSITLNTNGTNFSRESLEFKAINDGQGAFKLRLVTPIQVGGGLSQLGAVSGTLTEQGIYLIDGTNTLISLPASIGSQDRYIFNTQAAGIGSVVRVPVADTLNGVASGQYTVQSENQVLLFVDNGVGDWSFKLIGEAEIKTKLINSSAASTVETLATSTGLGVVKLYTNEDVTNTATLAVQVGETLNGVTDGTFLFSNYPSDTQFRVDEVTGGWVVSVVGVSTILGRNTTVLDHTTEITLVSGTTNLVFDNPSPSSGNVSANALSYYDEGSRRYLSFEMSLSDDDGFTLQFGANAIPVGATIEAINLYKGGTENVGALAFSFNSLGSGQFYVNKNNSLGTTSITVEIVLGGVAVGQVVLAGLVTPEVLHRASLVHNSSGYVAFVATSVGAGYSVLDLDDAQLTKYDPSGIVNTADNTFTIAQSGTYRVDFQQWDTTSDEQTNVYIDGVVSAYNYNPNGQTNGAIDRSSFFVNLTAGQKVEFGTISPTGGSGSGKVSLLVEQLPTSTVVMPDAVPVEDLHRAEIWAMDDGIEVAQANTTIGTGYNVVNFSHSQIDGIDNPNSLVDLANNCFTIAQDGLYNIYANGKSSGGITRLRIDGAIARSQSVSGNDIAINFYTDLVAGQQVELDAGNDPNSIIFGVKQSTAKTVTTYNGGDISVEDVEVELFAQQTGLTGVASYALGSGVTWDDVIAEYDNIRVEYAIDVTGVSERVYQSDVLKTSNISSSSRYRFEYGAAAVDFRFGITTGGNIDVIAFSSIDGYGFRIVGIKGQKTVINVGSVIPSDLNTLVLTGMLNNLTDLAAKQPMVFGTLADSNGSDISYNTTTGDLTLVVGKRYRVAVNPFVYDFSTTQFMDYGLTTSANLDVFTNSLSRLTGPNTTTNSTSDQGYEIIFTASGDGIYRMSTAGNSSGSVSVHPYSNMIVQELPSKEVILATDIEVVDQAASGYMDIGAMRMQWGTFTADNAGTDRTFVVPFADTNINMSVTLDTFNTDRIVSAQITATNTFRVSTFNSGSNSVSNIGEIGWFQAIGLKP